MISEKTLNIEWIKAVSSKNRIADKILIEKVIRALLLLEGLAESELDFVFKGGTALMLMQYSTKRLSIDIDIVTSDKSNLEPMFKIFLERKYFTRLELQDRKTNSDIDKAHYKFYYLPVHKTAQEEEYILLDLLFEEPQYQKTLSIDIDSSFLQQSGHAVKVKVPCFEEMLGDKLTAFAPNTTGIPYLKNGHSKSMEIIKQLYDIGNLFDVSHDLESIQESFRRFAMSELSYRNLEKNQGIVLKDIFNTALCISTRGKEGAGDFLALQKGISQIRAFIFSETFHIEKAIIQAAKAAYLSKLIELKENKFERFENAMQIKDWIIEQPFYNRLNKFKKSNPHAFFYWYKTYELYKESITEKLKVKL
jgi:predicted nucleotidyltransferase component of viral defense system